MTTMNENDKQAEPVAWRYCVAVTHRHGKGYVNRIKTSKLVCTIREAEVIQKEWESWARTGVFTVEIFPVYTAPPAVAINEQLLQTVKHILGWRELRNGNEFPVRRIEEMCEAAIAAAEAAKKGGV